MSPGNLEFSFDRQKAIPSGIDDVENSTDLDTWALVAGAMRSTSSISATLDRVTITLPTGEVRYFGRLSINVP